MKIWSKIESLFHEPETWHDQHEIDERNAEHIFNTYYRLHLVKYNPAFISDIKPHSRALDLIEEMSKTYGLPVPNNADLVADPNVYNRIQGVLLEIERNPKMPVWHITTRESKDASV